MSEESLVPDRWRPVRRLGVDETVSRRKRRFVTHLETDTTNAATEG